MTDKDFLDLGCGNSKPDDRFIGLNNVNTPDTDVVHDLETGRLPFEDNEFVRVRASHVLEHLTQDAFEDIMAEVARVLKPVGGFTVIGPHYLSFNSPAGDHYRAFSRRSMDCFTVDHDFVTGKPQKFRLQSIEYDMYEGLITQVTSKILGNRRTAQYLPNAVNEIKFELIYVGDPLP